jgi:tetratricopeptide (TPR) repeat protein
MASVPKQRSSDFDSDELDLLEKLGISSEATRCPPPDLLRAVRSDVVAGELKDAVKRHLRDCRVCQILAADLEEIQAPISSEESKRIHDHILGKIHPSKPSWNWRWLWAVVPASAIAAICLFIVWNGFPKHNSPHNSASVLSSATVFILEPPRVSAPIPLVMRGASQDGETYLSDLMRALAPYRAGEYEQAAENLDALAQKYPTSGEVAFYLGASLLMEGKNSDAVKILDRAEKLTSGSLAGACRWYLSIAEIRSQHADAAVAPLQDLCNRPGEYQARACAGLKELSSSHPSMPPR